MMKGVCGTLNPHRPPVAAEEFDTDTRFHSCNFSFFFHIWDPWASKFVYFVKTSFIMLSISNIEST